MSRNSTPHHRTANGDNNVPGRVRAAEHDDEAMRKRCKVGTARYAKALKAAGYVGDENLAPARSSGVDREAARASDPCRPARGQRQRRQARAAIHGLIARLKDEGVDAADIASEFDAAACAIAAEGQRP